MKFLTVGVLATLCSFSTFAGTSKWIHKPLTEAECQKIMPYVEKYLTVQPTANIAQESQYEVAKAACEGAADPSFIISGGRSNFGCTQFDSYSGRCLNAEFIVDSTDKGFRYLVNDGSMFIPNSPFDE